MNASSIGQRTFQTEALYVIFQEAQWALDAGYKGVNFECGRGEIRISYATSPNVSIGQAQSYANDHWQDICLAMRLVGRLAHRWGWPELVRLSEGMGFNCARWSIYSADLSDNLPLIIYQLLHRVDETIAVLDEHLELPVTN